MKHLGVSLKIKHDNVNLDGTFRKLMDSSLAKKYGWQSKTELDVGLSITINDYLKNQIFKEKNEKYYSRNWRSRFCWFKFN